MFINQTDLDAKKKAYRNLRLPPPNLLEMGELAKKPDTEAYESTRPLTIKQILENKADPSKEEFDQLKKLDAKINVLNFSTTVARKHSVLDPNSSIKSMNRYMCL